ncbi:MAG: hypothetical protein HWD62_08170 [Cyclobacteriaceae bacterium]|nr:MAG: hypothetical protein HWD62_08170 [Cyclobacteriaceae bacterium]
MKLDERLYQEEIKFCANTAAKLGYKPEVMFELMLKVKSTEMAGNEKKTLQELTNKYLN